MMEWIRTDKKQPIMGRVLLIYGPEISDGVLAYSDLKYIPSHMMKLITHWMYVPDPPIPKKCAIPGCTNTSDKGKFVGVVCSPCYAFLHGHGSGPSAAKTNFENFNRQLAVMTTISKTEAK